MTLARPWVTQVRQRFSLRNRHPEVLIFKTTQIQAPRPQEPLFLLAVRKFYLLWFPLSMFIHSADYVPAPYGRDPIFIWLFSN